MKHLCKKLALLAIPILLYLAFFIAFEPNNYFGLRNSAASTAPIARVRAFVDNPGDYLLLGDSRLAHFDMEAAAQTSGKPWQNLAFGGAITAGNLRFGRVCPTKKSQYQRNGHWA